jgi:hypothetical protein
MVHSSPQLSQERRTCATAVAIKNSVACDCAEMSLSEAFTDRDGGW